MDAQLFLNECMREVEELSTCGISISYKVWAAASSAYPEGRQSLNLSSFFTDLSIQMNLNMGLKNALNRKKTNLKKTHFNSKAQNQLLKIWQTGSIELESADRLGRFDRFSRGWNKVTHYRQLLNILKFISKDDVDTKTAISAVKDYISDNNSPLKKTARFSEVLHLTRPDVFPVINDANSIAVMCISGNTEVAESRENYLDAIEEIDRIRRNVGIKSWFQFDLFCHAIEARILPLLNYDDDEPYYSILALLTEVMKIASSSAAPMSASQ